LCIIHIRTAVNIILDAPTCLYSYICFRCQLYSRELHGDNALKHSRRTGTATTYAAELRELAGAVQSGSARLEGHHATRYAICQAQRAGYAVGDSHPYVRATGHRNTRRTRWTQLTTVSIHQYFSYAYIIFTIIVAIKFVLNYVTYRCEFVIEFEKSILEGVMVKRLL